MQIRSFIESERRLTSEAFSNAYFEITGSLMADVRHVASTPLLTSA
jgi:hypothetical protein